MTFGCILEVISKSPISNRPQLIRFAVDNYSHVIKIILVESGFIPIIDHNCFKCFSYFARVSVDPINRGLNLKKFQSLKHYAKR